MISNALGVCQTSPKGTPALSEAVAGHIYMQVIAGLVSLFGYPIIPVTVALGTFITLKAWFVVA